MNELDDITRKMVWDLFDKIESYDDIKNQAGTNHLEALEDILGLTKILIERLQDYSV